jgi:hypothetical protein
VKKLIVIDVKYFLKELLHQYLFIQNLVEIIVGQEIICQGDIKIMQSEEYHKQFGRGFNVSCHNYNCQNFRKKISRSRSGWYSRSTVCPICHEDGFVHTYTCKVGKDNKMQCNCHITRLR